MIYDVVLGGVLSATFIPVFVDWLSTRGTREGWRAISAIVSLSSVVLVVMTAVFLVAAPAVIDAFTRSATPRGAAGSTSPRSRRSPPSCSGGSSPRWPSTASSPC